MSSSYFPLRGDQIGQVKFPIGCQVYLVENIDGKYLIQNRATVRQCLLQMTPTVKLLYKVKTHTGEIQIQQQDSLRYQNACRVLYKTDRPAVILGILTRGSKHWYSIELEDNSKVIYEVELEDLTGISVENTNVEVQENERDGQKLQNSGEEQKDEESIVSIEPMVRVKEDPDDVGVLGNEIIMENHALDCEIDKTVESNHEIDGDNNLQMGQNNNDNGIANREHLRKPESIIEKSEHNDNMNSSSGGNALVSTSQNSIKTRAEKSSNRGVLEIEQRLDHGINRQQDIRIDQNCSNKRKRTNSNDHYDNSKSIRSFGSNSRSRRVSTSSSNYQNVENIPNDRCSPCEGGRNSIQDNVNSSRGSFRQDWKIVNGRILFWCDRCSKNRGEWTNHRSSHHGNGLLKYNIILRYNPQKMEPSTIMKRIENAGQVFYSDLLKRGFGVMIVDENAMKEVRSIMDKNKQGFSPHLQVWPSASRSTSFLQKVTNYDYHEAMFRPFQKDIDGAIKRDFDNIPTSSWRDTKVCIYYHVLGDCVRDCRCATDHRESGEEKLSQILQWCLRNIKQTNEKIENHHYRRDMFQKHTLHMYKFMTSDKIDFPKSQWGDFPMCIKFHVEGICSGYCKFVEDHRVCRQDKLEDLLSWCQRRSSGDNKSNRNHSDKTGHPVQEVSISNQNFNIDVFGKFANNIPEMLVHSKTLPLSKLGNRALCLDYHLKGRCKSSCSFDHEECDKEKISELFEWCKSSSLKNNKEINESYLPQLFESYKDGLRGALRIVNNRQSVPTDDNNQKICVFYHVMGSCRADCSFRHRSCSNDLITKLLNWCAECIDAEPREVSNPDYNEEMFGSFVSSLPSLLRKSIIPASEFGNFEMCINYHVKSTCKDTCPRAADHRPISATKLKELLNWCQTDVNPNYEKELFLPYQKCVSKFIVEEKQTPFLEYQKSKVCIRYNVRGYCHPLCPFEHRICDDNAITDLFNWCRYNLKDRADISRDVINPNYQKEEFQNFAKEMPQLLRTRNKVPLSKWTSKQICLNYFVKGRCFSECPRSLDHRDCGKEKIDELLKWCRQSSSS